MIFLDLFEYVAIDWPCLVNLLTCVIESSSSNRSERALMEENAIDKPKKQSYSN